MKIETTTTIYFKDMLEEAFRNQKVKTDTIVEFYLVNLLAEFITTEKIKRFSEEPIVMIMDRAFNSGFYEQRVLLKEIGDVTLYVSGFFSDSFKRKLVDVDYYSEMGSHAYQCLANLTRDTRTILYDLYSELASKFKAFVDILVEVSERCLLTSHKDILRIYERWLRMRTKRNEELLRKLGIDPILNLDHTIIH